MARQYSGTAGRVENCQIGVFLTYATKHGRTLLDRELYIPKAWTEDPDRCTKAGIPAERHTLATKPELAADMIERVLDAGVQAQWVAGDTVYGANHGLRERLEARRMHYVLAVPKNHTVVLPSSDTLGSEGRADDVVAALDARAWRNARQVPGPKATGDTLGRGNASLGPPMMANIGYWLADRSKTPPMSPISCATRRSIRR